jgi:MFS family permease
VTQPSSTSTFDATRNVRLLFAYSFVANFQLWFGIWIIYLTDYRGISLFQVGLLETFFQLVALVSIVPAGAFADRFGRRHALAVSAAVGAAGLMLFAYASNYPLLLGSYVLWALSGSFLTPAGPAYLYDALVAGNREHDFTKLFGRMNAIVIGGFLLGTLLGSPLAQATSLQLPVALSVFSYGGALLLALLMSEPPRARRGEGLTYVQTLAMSGRIFRHDAAIRYVVLFSVGASFAAVAHIMLLQPFLRSHAVPIAAFGVILAPVRLLSMGAAASAHVVSSTLGFRRSFALLGAAPVLLLLLLGIIDHVTLFLALGAINVVGMLRNPLVVDYISRRTESDVRATVLAVRGFGFSLVFAVMSPIAGAFGEDSLQTAFLVLAACCAAVVLPAYLLWLRADRAAARVEAREEAAGDD